jgi:hypothetical protein
MTKNNVSVDNQTTAADVLGDVLEVLDHVKRGAEIAEELAAKHDYKARTVQYGGEEYEEATQRRFAHLVRQSVYEEVENWLTDIIIRHAVEK